MAAIVQTYRVGVQNRYSAFLDGDEGLALSNSIGRPVNIATNKHQKTSAGSKSTSSKNEPPTGVMNKKQTGPAKSSSTPNAQQGQVRVSEAKRQQSAKTNHQQVHQSGGNIQVQQARNQQNKGRNQHQGSSTTEGLMRNARNMAHNGSGQQSDGPQQQTQQTKENRGTTRSSNNPRFNRLRVQNGERRSEGVEPQDVQQLNGHLPSNEGDKARHQQRRMNNSRFRDPEKKERRTQGSGGAETQVKSEQQSKNEPGSQEPRSPRVRRDGDKSQDVRNKPRPRRINPSGGESNKERRDVRRDRPVRQRDGFGTGFNSEVGPQGRPKPIPNFSDKSDFPSLAS